LDERFHAPRYSAASFIDGKPQPMSEIGEMLMANDEALYGLYSPSRRRRRTGSAP
jgi:hypothetical protein